MLVPLVVLAFIAVAATVTAAGILALGSLLSRLFAVTAFEGSAIVVGAALLWLLWIGWSGPALAATDQTGADEEERQPVIILDALPVPPRRRAKQRKQS